LTAGALPGPATARRDLALFIPSFRGGGAERVMLTLAGGFAARGFAVDLLVAQDEGSYRTQVPQAVRVVDLAASRVLKAVPGLVRYLREARPRALLSALPHANVAAVWARAWARTPTRLVLSEHTTASQSSANSAQRRARLLPLFMRRAYPRADAVVAVSDAAADDLAKLIRMDRSRLCRIYNPVVTPELLELASEPLGHPWFADGAPPVVLAAGRLTEGKDFATLLRAFAGLRRVRPARLLILGEGRERANLESLAAQLDIRADFELPGFVANPFRFMRRAAVFALSSRWEGFGNVLVEAMACGAPVVATDCPGGPREILESGRHGKLVPVGDAGSLARALAEQLDSPMRASIVARAGTFSADAAIAGYRAVLAL
jgi:glycosyltransferase involved in cell wall biosynthesis